LEVESQAQYECFFRELGARLKVLRRKAGYSQEDMLSYGFSTRHWQQIEAGRPVTVTTLLRVCDAFCLPPEKILKGLYEPAIKDDPKKQ
jgi:transcriptional regulator with XRE-family HTH domain